MNAVGVINEMVKHFIVDGTAGHLPISLVAYTVLPQLVLSFDLRFCSNGIGRKTQAHNLAIYNELNRQYDLRYDVSHVASWVNDIICMFETSVSYNSLRTTKPEHSGRLCPQKGSFLFQIQPAIYLQLTSVLDTSLSTGRLALGYLQSTETLSATSLTELSSPLEFPIGPTLALARPSCSLEDYHSRLAPEGVVNIDFYTPEAAGHLKSRSIDRVREPCSNASSPDTLHKASRDEDSRQSSTRDAASIDLLWGSIALLGE
jgi:hypothetical protein